MTQKLSPAPNAPPEIETSSHIAVKPLYTPADLKGSDYESEVGYPGEYPFTRGVQATMYRGRLWTMRQYAGMGDAEEWNKRYKYLLANGTTGLQETLLRYHGESIRSPQRPEYRPHGDFLDWHGREVFKGASRHLQARA